MVASLQTLGHIYVAFQMASSFSLVHGAPIDSNTTLVSALNDTSSPQDPSIETSSSYTVCTSNPYWYQDSPFVPHVSNGSCDDAINALYAGEAADLDNVFTFQTRRGPQAHNPKFLPLIYGPGNLCFKHVGILTQLSPSI